MPFAIMQILDPATGRYVDWDGKLHPGADGTLGQIVVKKVLEERVLRVKGIDVVIAANGQAAIATHSVPVGQVHKVFGYALTANSPNVDWFKVEVAGQGEAKVYAATYEGGIVDDYLLIDNSAGAAPVAVVLMAHNADPVSSRLASGVLLVEDVTNSQAPSS